MAHSRYLRRGQKGFTLLEVMVVIVIIGLMAMLVIPNIMGSKAKADQQKAKADISMLESSLEMYHLDNNRYPTTEQGLQALVKKPVDDPLPAHYDNGGYIKHLPKDPWGHDYQLLNPGKHGSIDVYSIGSDGKEDTEDDIGNWAAESP
ncbi:type II secretion system major pseudopilin GspG [Erwinia tracheiphila]|uniref:Type II secretion system core protein G n=1 Tax=Erwinia tracheiphila TaxID=65700 RepID=A0A345CWA1_9GAMM|nr:type II secretion system major pseudopilin GspG [Erwinia tracheiphila]AXF77718.1 type II secretion system protein GspG [Erwinia tracheiphila]UIA83596.1 type II secretion system major pseudopilin GspG [Erwinia tracheiphila]UIA92181.1 type II secretion system major pseudopilin GspG [Erwinia tracheiphila]